MLPVTPPDADQTVNDAIAAIRSGDKERGRSLLAQVLRLNPYNEQAWLWMAAVVETPERQRECLERALTINPQNEIARRGLKTFATVRTSSSIVQHAGQMSTIRQNEYTRSPDRSAYLTSPASSHAISYQPGAPVSRETPDAPAPPGVSTTLRCPQCSAALSHIDDSCAFCSSRVARVQENVSSSPYTPVSSYPKRRSLTRKEQPRLVEQTWRRTPVDRLFNTATISGSIVLALCIGMATAPLFIAIDESGTMCQTNPAMYLLWLILLSV